MYKRQVYDYPKQELNIDGKKVLKSVIKLQEGDCIVAMSDGDVYKRQAPHSLHLLLSM